MRTSETLDRLPVNRERALRAAVKLADAEGIDAVSMRNLAALLGVVPMALYRHVAGKEDLLNGMIDVLIAEHRIPDVGDDWQQAVRERILSARATLLRHPWARGVLETRSTRTHAVLSYMDSLAGMFIGGGFSANLTHHVMHALGHRIWGFSPEAFEDSDALAVPTDPDAQARLMDHMSQTYPHILAIAMAASGGAPGSGSCDEQFEFEFALDLLLDAFARLHAAGWSSPQA